MKRPLPLWVAAVVPATLAGHGVVYALAGQSVLDGRHNWLDPVLECSLAFLAAVCLFYASEALLKARILTHTPDERSCTALWVRLAFAQAVLFVLMERAEGGHAGIAGILVQVIVSLFTAYILTLFARVLDACAQYAERVSLYVARDLRHLVSFVSREPLQTAFALAACTGTARFQRPPPQH